MCPIRFLIIVGFTPAIGSSSRMSSGSDMSAMPKSRSFCWPYERFEARLSWSRAMPRNSSSARARRFFGLLAAEQAGEQRAGLLLRGDQHVLEHGHLGKGVDDLDRPRDAPL